MSGGHVHYVIVERGRVLVKSRHRAAAALLPDLLLGPAAFEALVRGVRNEGWGNAVFWHGFVLLDPARRLLLVQTLAPPSGHGLRGDLLEVRAWLKLIAGRWPRWTVRWAPRGLHEVAELLDLPERTIPYLDDPPHVLSGQWAQAPAEEDDPETVAEAVIVVDGPDGPSFRGWWLPGMADPLLAGPEVLTSGQSGAASFAVLGAVPWSGAHLDPERRRLDWWSLDCATPRAALRWPGWTLVDHGDAYEEVVARWGTGVLLEAGDEADALRRIRARFPAA